MNKSYGWVHKGYGKNNVKLLHVRRDGPQHTIHEFEVGSQLTLSTDKDYIHGDNSDIIATDSQKNTIYLLAKKNGITSPELFALQLCEHYFNKYPHVTEVKIDVEKYPWRRFVVDGKAHNHAFLFSPEVTHMCTAIQKRGELPILTTGMEGFRVLKTTQSAFVNFVSDEYRSLPDMADRVFSTTISANWTYSSVEDTDFGLIWQRILKIICDKFAGPAEVGIYSPSVQNTAYITQEAVLNEIPKVVNMEITMPNKHYFSIDLSKFPGVGCENNNEVFLPVDKPSGNITSKLGRVDIQSKL